MTEAEISEVMNNYVRNGELSGAALLVRRGDEVLYESQWGYADIAAEEKITFDSIYRMMSMTKCITAAAVMICVERHLFTLDTPVSDFIPCFHNMQVMDDERYVFSVDKMKKLPFMLLTFSMKKVKRKLAGRDITVRDLLSHSSGLQQGLVGLLDMLKDRRQYTSLKEWVCHYADNVLDFEPGMGTGYSPLAGFDLLAYLVSLRNGCTFEEIDRYLWNTGFHFGEWLIPSRPHDDPKRPYYRGPETSFFIAPFFGYMTIHKMAEIFPRYLLQKIRNVIGNKH